MKIFLTGGAGYIGSVTTEQLLNEGHEVVVFDSLERGHREAVDPRAYFIQGDLRNFSEIHRALLSVKPEAVMHFAAYALVGESMRHPELYFNNNMIGGVHLANAAVEAGVKKFIFSSTCATYGEPKQIPMTETLPQLPTNPYGESKLMLEKVLLWYKQLHGLKPVFLRYFNAAGATVKYGEDHDPETHIIPNVLKVALGMTDKITIHGDDYETPDGTCIRDYIHIVDLAQAHMLALRSDISGAFNLGNGSGHSVKEVIAAARDVTGHPIPTAVSARRPGDPPRLIAAAEQAKSVLGWKPQRPEIRTIIADAWGWMQRHPHGYKS